VAVPAHSAVPKTPYPVMAHVCMGKSSFVQVLLVEILQHQSLSAVVGVAELALLAHQMSVALKFLRRLELYVA